MICGLILKYLNMSGLVMIGRYETNLPFTSQFPLTLPIEGIKFNDGVEVTDANETCVA